MATATYRKFDVKHGLTVNGLPFVDGQRNVIVNDLTVQGVSTIIDTRTITSVDPVISLGVSGKTYTSTEIIPGTPGRIKFSKEDFSDIAVGDAIKYEVGVGGTIATGLADGTVYYVVSREPDVSSDDYLTITISLVKGGSPENIASAGFGSQLFTLNPLRDLNQDLGIEFNYVDGVPQKGFFGYKDSTGHFTFLLNTSYSGSDDGGDVGSPVFTGAKGGLEAKYIKLEPSAALIGNVPAIDIDQTWDDVASIFKAIEIDIVDTASDPSSNLLDIAVGGQQKLLLRKDGALSLNSSSYGAVLNVNQGSIDETTLIKGTATWNDVTEVFYGIDLQVTETAFAAGSKLINLSGSVDRSFSVGAYGNIESNVEFTGGTTQTAIKLDVTDTSSDINSLLLDLQVGSVSKFSVDKSGNIVAAGDLTVQGGVSFEDFIDIKANPNGSGTYEDNTRVQTSHVIIPAGTATATVINTFDKTEFITGKYLIQMKQGSNYHSAEVLLIHDGSGAFMTEYAAVWNSSILGTLDAAVSGNNVNLTFMATAATVAANSIVDVKVTRISLVD
jgi:hypothetical protein